MNELYDGLLEELECKICMTYMSPPIRQCETGHSICESCRHKLPRCPLCQGQFTESRNISLEALARKMHYPCINIKMGCNVRLSLEARDKHERQCAYKGYKCAYPKCPWNGRYEDILEHWAQKKQTSRPYRNVNVCHTKIQKTETFYVNMVQAYDQLFWYKFKTNGGKMYWSIQYIGNSERATDYFFEIELFKPGQPIRRYLMSEYCQPDGVDLFRSGNCVMASTEAVNHFFGDDQLLIYYMRIKETASVEADKSECGSSVSSRRDRDSSVGPKEDGQSGQSRRHNFKGYNQKRGNPKKKPASS